MDINSKHAAVRSVLKNRYSCRRYLSIHIADEILQDLLSLASLSPSGSNTQPWKTYVLRGGALSRISKRIYEVANDDFSKAELRAGYTYAPNVLPELYDRRRKKFGQEFYGYLGIPRGDEIALKVQNNRNLSFYGAPVGLVFTIDRNLERGSYIDYGIFLQTLMIAAKSRGLDTCVQGALIKFQDVFSQELNFTSSEIVICTMALGYGDPAAFERGFRTSRIPSNRWAVFV